jgi:hypothetical protein
MSVTALVLGLFGLGTTAVSAAALPAPRPDAMAVGMARDRGISLAEATQRLGWQAHAPSVSQRASAVLGGAFGGVWIDAAHGGRVKIGVTAAAGASGPRTAMTAAALTGLTDGVDVVTVNHSAAELDAANTWLGSQLVAVNAGARSPLAVGERTDRNAVELDVPAGGPLTNAQNALIQAAQSRLGDALVLSTYAGQPTPRACAYPFCDPPLRGGIRITSNGGGCTGAFIAQSRVDSNFYQFTAGHCGQASLGPWATQFTDGSTHLVGPIHHWEWNAGGDEAIMLVNNPNGWQLPSATVNVTDGPNTTADPNYAISSENFSVLGQRICTTGAFLGFSSCGTVTELELTTTYGGVTVNHLGRGSFCGVAGDSGAPMYASHVAFGLQVAGFSECDSIYQGILAAESVLNVNVLNQ